ncbi:hypothetical protein BU24DRAFT_454118 [Aaosphaeria arxii CBS 175.79]|uniref:MARVEL domain-containing protein n=1 Tax=Aaosphaeria arxii CBS 175.79 TaxID=1450172 RepID=A0A6A5XFK6_9PLEO|nr:uncharacterized protein BU24DRAFT_454118 [Aaosphaeria arxii CBS 175.79]KAF2011607.1 hypothetical protein BU24DRAFT_454118 [Aaosphaeria arxii CBS 175.79]
MYQSDYTRQQQPFLAPPPPMSALYQGRGYHDQSIAYEPVYPPSSTGNQVTSMSAPYWGQDYRTQSTSHAPLHHSPTSIEDPMFLDDVVDLKIAQKEDKHLKSNIRRLRLISRLIALFLSIATLVPLTMTLIKFLSTKHVFRDIVLPDGTTKHRTAWSKDPKTWPTWTYFLVAAASALINVLTLICYCICGVKEANRTALVSAVVTWGSLVGQLVVWIVAAAMYRAEKSKGGKSNDLWGWTCAPAAKAIQKEFVGVVDFNYYCNVQTASWYTGLIQCAAALFSLVIYIFVLKRQKSKKEVKRMSLVMGVESK